MCFCVCLCVSKNRLYNVDLHWLTNNMGEGTTILLRVWGIVLNVNGNDFLKPIIDYKSKKVVKFQASISM